MPKPSPEEIAAARKGLGVPDERIPRSVAIIMDGNGRWALERRLPRSAGHEEGAKVVRKIVIEAARLGLEALTLYSFSTENWCRPSEEVDVLMHLYAEYLVRERPTIMENNVRLVHLGRREGLPEPVLRELDESVAASQSNTGMYLCLALNYGARMEITEAVRCIARRVANGELEADKIDESVIASSLYSANVPDPDLVIRTAGEMRVSNFLLWQISYAEYYCSEKFWPDFDEAEFCKGIRAYAERQRRYGGLDPSGA
jgi:undecaprenyl diphosphate synthase